MAIYLQFASEVNIVLEDLFSPLLSFKRTQDSQLGQRSSGLGWVDDSSVHVGSRHLAEDFDDIGVLDADESDVGAEALTSCSHQNHVGAILKVLHLPHSPPLGAKMTKIVSAVNEQKGSVLLGDVLVEVKVGRVAVHGKEPLSHHENGTIRVVLPRFFK